MPLGITFTGVDNRTDIRCLPAGAEYAFLYSKRTGGENRYPCRSAIANKLSLLRSTATALHVCGRGAKEQLLQYRIADMTHLVQRIQVNGEVTPHELMDICDLYSGHEIITQHVPHREELLMVDRPNHSIVVDGSGGRGITPETWLRPDTNKRVGFAGGIGPDNILQQLQKITQVARDDDWIDMETKLRNADDWFDTTIAYNTRNLAFGSACVYSYKREDA